MMPSLFGPTALFAVLLWILPAYMNGQDGAFDLDMLQSWVAFVPSECQDTGEEGVEGGPELDDALACVVSNLMECRGLISVLDPDLIPGPGEISNCTDVEEPYCDIEKECEACSAVISSLMQCIVTNTEGMDENTTALVESCDLIC